MLRSLEIRNFKNLQELTINSLGRVNLITGKNNTGKSTLLEAVVVFATRGDFDQINQLLKDRGESFKKTDPYENVVDSNIRTLSSLFSNRRISFTRDTSISIGSSEINLFGERELAKDFVSIRFVKYSDEVYKDGEGFQSRKRTILENEVTGNESANYKIGLETRSDANSYIVPLDEDRPFRYSTRERLLRERQSINKLSAINNFQFIRTKNIDRVINSNLWDRITLTDREQNVIDALKIIEPLTDRIAFVNDEDVRERIPLIKLSNEKSILPLRSMGDGMNRILTIILALVNSDNGYLLIDEFENGLHYTVQRQLWDIIFRLSKQLNVQVFATTHSEDSISSFENVLNSQADSLVGRLIRLDNRNGIIQQVGFDANELKIATAQNIEIR